MRQARDTEEHFAETCAIVVTLSLLFLVSGALAIVYFVFASEMHHRKQLLERGCDAYAREKLPQIERLLKD